MAKQGSVMLVLGLLVLLNSFSRFSASDTCNDMPELKRSDFPRDFAFGAASASYQSEGAANEGGIGQSNWYDFTHSHPEKITDHSNADIAVDFYHRYKEDVSILKDMGMNAFRFSISWSRILPRGKISGGINTEGIKFYNNLTNELLANGIEPYMTIFHWDLPQALEDEYGGFLHENIIDDFKEYAELCFILFGDRVKNWMTMNEPYVYTTGGYVQGTKPPLRCSKWEGNCSVGDSATEPYVVTHHQLLAHAAAVKVYRDNYQRKVWYCPAGVLRRMPHFSWGLDYVRTNLVRTVKTAPEGLTHQYQKPWQKGKIGIAFNCFWMEPISDATADKQAAERALDFMLGWYMKPLVYGHYPKYMQTHLGERLPRFNPKQSHMVKGSFDFVGLNYYTARYVADIPLNVTLNVSFTTDSRAKLTSERDGVPIGPQSDGSSWLYIYPVGLHNILMYLKNNYKDPVIHITENGVSEKSNNTEPRDQQRIDYYSCHLKYLLQAMRKGANVKGFFPWSLMDNFEWNAGYTARFGIYYVDFKNGLKRIPKASACWFKHFLQTGVMDPLKINPYCLHSASDGPFEY